MATTLAWIDEHREDLLLRSRLDAAVNDWEAADRSDTYLLTAGRLSQHEAWTANTDLGLTSTEQKFLVASRLGENRRHTRRRRTRRLVMAGFGAAAIIAFVLAGAALLARNDAQHQATAADAAHQIALSRELALQSVQQLGIDPERSMLLAIEAIELGRAAGSDASEATTALHQAIQSQRVTNRFPGGGFVAVSPDGDLAATADEGGNVAVWNLDTGAAVKVFERPGAVAIGASFSPDGSSLGAIYAGVVPPVWIWDLTSGVHTPLDGNEIPSDQNAPFRIGFSKDGETVAWNPDGRARVWSLESGEHYNVAVAGDMEFSRVANLLIVADHDAKIIRILDQATGTETGNFAVDGFSPESIALSPDGSRIAIISSLDRVLAIYDMDSGHELVRATVDRPNGQIAWFPSGDRVLVGGDAGKPRVFDAQTGAVVVELLGHQGIVWATATTQADNVAVTTGLNDQSMIVWNVKSGLLPEAQILDSDVERMRDFAYIGNGDSVFVSGTGDPATVMTIDAQDATPRLVLDGLLVQIGKETRPVGDGTVAAAVGVDGTSTIVSLTTGETLYVAPKDLIARGMSVAGDRVLLAAKAFSDDPGDPSTVIAHIATSESVTLAGNPNVAAAGFSPDGSLVWTWGGLDYVFYDTSTGEEIFRLAVFKVMFMPDGEGLAVIDEEGVLHLANVDDLANGVTLQEASRWRTKAHDSFTPLLEHNSDGTLVMTGGFAEPAKVWNAVDGSLVAEFDSGLTDKSPRGAFHPSRPHVTLMSDEAILLTFTLDTDELIDIARSRLTRDLSEAECQIYLHVDTCPDR